MWPDIFNDDAFSLISLTALINKEDYVPGRAGELAFAGVSEGIATTTAVFEEIGTALSLIQTSPRGGPAPQERPDKATVRGVAIPQIKLEDTINAHEIQNVRQIGSTDTLRGPQTVIQQRMRKMGLRFDLTLENLRLGALRGEVRDADGSLLENLYTLFGVQKLPDLDFTGVFVAGPDSDDLVTIRTFAQRIVRRMKRNLKAPYPGSARVWAFCGDNFFDALIESTSVRGVYDGWNAAERRLGGNYAHGVYSFADVFWENYQGTDDNSTVAIGPNECQFFLTGVPGLYEEYFAPGDFLETVNTIGLPRYAKIAQADKFNRSVALHVQSNPLPVCLRPRTLFKGVWGEVPTDHNMEGTTE